MDASERCQGSYRDARNVRNLSHCGSKSFGKALGECAVCGGPVGVRKGTIKANAHKPRRAVNAV